jgi:hypothetical protein
MLKVHFMDNEARQHILTHNPKPNDIGRNYDIKSVKVSFP